MSGKSTYQGARPRNSMATLSRLATAVAGLLSVLDTSHIEGTLNFRDCPRCWAEYQVRQELSDAEDVIGELELLIRGLVAASPLNDDGECVWCHHEPTHDAEDEVVGEGFTVEEHELRCPYRRGMEMTHQGSDGHVG